MTKLRPRFKFCSFENYKITNPKQKAIVDTLRAWVKDFAPEETENGFIFLGNPGTGKNHLTAAIVRDIEKNKYSWEIEKCCDLLARIRKTWNPESLATEDEIIREYRLVDLLVIDDAHIGPNSDKDREYLYRIIDYRCDYFRPTILTANCNLDSLSLAIGPWCIDRIYRAGGKNLIFDWQSHRPTPEAKSNA
jgi:DNA replication protein DnaC